jgi:predicted restriction endonuclease
MNNKRDYRGFLRTIVWSPRAFLLLVFGVGSVIWAANKYWIQGRTDWIETKAKLADIQLNERLRNKKKEMFLKLTFDYNAGDQKYQAVSEEILFDEFQAEAKTRELKEAKDLVSIYYQDDNPNEATFDIQETKPDDSLLYVLIPSLIIIGALGYWGLRIRYNHYYRTEN